MAPHSHYGGTSQVLYEYEVIYIGEQAAGVWYGLCPLSDATVGQEGLSRRASVRKLATTAADKVIGTDRRVGLHG